VRRPSNRRGPLLVLVMCVGAVVLAAWPVHRARGLERNFAGSAQLDYLAVPTDSMPRRFGFDGFTLELSLKLAVDFTEHVSGNVKVCYGCHGVEAGMAYFDFRVVDELNFRVGRFNPSFGDFPLRHDPANHRTSDKPLPYDMGRMLRLREWGMSVLPAPYVENGVEINGTHWFGESVQVDYAAYAVAGLKGANDGVDVDYLQSRSGSLYYIDNNSQPVLGARLALTVNLGELSSLTFGGSGMHGTYDPARELTYTILGADATFRLNRWNVRAEYLMRRTEMALGADPARRFRYGPGEDGDFDPYFLKDGFVVETDFPVWPWLELVGRFDGMRRLGNVVTSSPLRKESLVLRYTAGANVVFERSFRLKLSGELYDFSDFDDEVAIHLGLVGAF
jgi:hypothetical protein